MLHARNQTLSLDGTYVDYIRFGRGDKHMILIPGLGEGLQSMKGLALPFAILYRKFAKDFTVHVFSRKREVPEGITSRDMARDTIVCMDMVGVERASVVGVSQGGTIGQWMAIDYPRRIDKLVLVVTYARANDVLNTAIPRWLELGRLRDFGGLMIDTAENSYSLPYLKKVRWLYPFYKLMPGPKSCEKFLRMGEACLTHNAYDRLREITCPTLIIGGEQDKIVGPQGSYELAEQITGSALYMYPEYGHGLYEEAKDFNDRVLAFLR